jgi:hypothetical protein
MDVELTNNYEELIKILGDRTEEIERTLSEDEDFCNKDIDETYQAAVKFIKSIQTKFDEKLNELKDKLDQIRKENINISKQNQKQFDDEIDEVNELFSSGKHQEGLKKNYLNNKKKIFLFDYFQALEKFRDYEKHFEQRTTLIRNIPKIYTNDIDINQYFSIDKPINIPSTQPNINKRHSSDNIKPTKTEFFKKENDDTNGSGSIQ